MWHSLLGKIMRRIPPARMRRIVHRNCGHWIHRAMKTPYFNIVHDGSIYMERYWLFRTRALEGRIHIIRRSDRDRHLHDHPWDSISLILLGSYIEEVPAYPDVDPGGVHHRTWHLRRPGDVVVRKAKDAHRLLIGAEAQQFVEPEDTDSACATLFITGPKIHSWGFHTEEGWLPWREYLSFDPETQNYAKQLKQFYPET